MARVRSAVQISFRSVFYSCSRLKYYENLMMKGAPSIVQIHRFGVGHNWVEFRPQRCALRP